MQPRCKADPDQARMCSATAEFWWVMALRKLLETTGMKASFGKTYISLLV